MIARIAKYPSASKRGILVKMAEALMICGNKRVDRIVSSLCGFIQESTSKSGII